MDNIRYIQQKIPNHVTLLAVSKGQQVERIEKAYQLGIHQFGENYLQEAIPKIQALNHLNCTWHYIGKIQTNKCKKITQYFDWVQTVDRLETAQKLNQSCQELQKSLNICIQINLHDEIQKGGISIHDAPLLINAIQNTCKHLCLKGLMNIPPQQLNTKERIETYLKLQQLQTTWNQQFHLQMDTLSMGMSEDYQEAILHGSTMVRIGTALFGPRPGKELL